MKFLTSILCLLVIAAVASAGHYGANAQLNIGRGFYPQMAPADCGCAGTPAGPVTTFAPQLAPTQCTQSAQQTTILRQSSYAGYAQQAQFVPQLAPAGYGYSAGLTIQRGLFNRHHGAAGTVVIQRGLINRHHR